MLSSLRPHLSAPAGEPVEQWQAGDVCSEFRGLGLELQLIDAVDERDRARAASATDLPRLEARVRSLQDQLVDLGE
ncbi:hypothetical protein [Iamia sp.]|uniref:hypothetical protein n=1 Tax=Iamia sp. TaxID=2722710 RepID=UPI002CB80EAF|nr:hypothetical protein [Iamia sp.]HXH58980.1 hypothetical protein [Iamia sp.]